MTGIQTIDGSPYDKGAWFLQRVAQGDVLGHTTTIVRGHSPAQASASGMVDIGEFGNLTYLATAETMNIVSDDAADTSAGTGARTVLVQGVDNTGAAVQEVIVMDGVTPVLTVQSYLRVNSMIVLTVGTGTVNAGTITATSSAAVTLQDQMGAEDAVSACSFFTVPLGVTFYVLKAEFNVARLAGGNAPVVEFEARARVGGLGAAFVLLFDKRLDAAVVSEYDVIPAFPAALAARSDIVFRSDTDQNDTETRSRLYGLLIQD